MLGIVWRLRREEERGGYWGREGGSSLLVGG